MVTYPSHCTHTLQEIDLVIAKKFKAEVKNFYYRYLKLSGYQRNQKIPQSLKQDLVLKSILPAFQVSTNLYSCQTAFSKGGKVPFNPQKVLESYYVSNTLHDPEMEYFASHPNALRINSLLLTDVNYINFLNSRNLKYDEESEIFSFYE